MNTRSLRFRLVVWYSAALFAALAVSGSTLWLALRQRLLSELDGETGARATRFQNYLATEMAEGERGSQLKDELDEFCQALPGGSSLRLTGQSGFGFSCGHETGAVRGSKLTFSTAGEQFALEVNSPLEQTNKTLGLVGSLLMSLLPGALLIAVAGGAWLGRRALQPVDAVAKAAQETGIDDLSRRLPVAETGDELQGLTEAWNDSLGRLEMAMTTLSRFAADASHELRTPLAVIRTSAEVALRKARSAEAYRESLEEIAAEAGRMTQLVEDLLLLSRTEALAGEMRKAPVQIDEVLAEAVREMNGFAQMRNVRVQGPEGATVAVKANRPALKRLLLVLVENAIKYSPEGGEVVVSIDRDARRVTAVVADHGCGIRSQDRERIFERFYQADPSRHDGGFGLGLSLAQSIARAHGTEISVESAEGEGSTFRVGLEAAA